MYLTQEELKTVAYNYQVQQIIEEDGTIAEIAINAAIEEMKSYLRNRYDVDLIFSETGTNRNALILELTKDIALWNIIKLSNVDMIFERIKERYDRAINYLDKILSGGVSINLPPAVDGSGNEIGNPIKWGSSDKQSWDW
jgi:phage gp36-like protein